MQSGSVRKTQNRHASLLFPTLFEHGMMIELVTTALQNAATTEGADHREF
jgi:hypothetical protein